MEIPLSLASLQDAVSAKTRFEYLFFWGHTPKSPGMIDSSCFSQWYPSPFEVDGIRYATAEHWMMACKASLFNDKPVLEEILTAKTPAEAKKLGRKISNFQDQIWDENKFRIVTEGSRHKFSSNPEMQAFLLATGEKILVEASPYDRIWGIGMTRDHPHAKNPRLWKGENLLGFALMQVREEMKGNTP